jgi:DNA-binding CsgD family transcriptional regulator
MQLLPVRAARAEAAWLAGDDVGARREAECGLTEVTAEVSGWATGELARWARRAGESVDPAWPAAEPFVHELAGRADAAAAAWDARGCPYDAALALLDGDPPALRRALARFESLGAGPAAARTRQLMRDRGVRPPAHGIRRSTRTNPAGLTDRETEVLELVRGGLTDAEIAARLVLSVKTVGHHVSAILAKSGARSRREAARSLPAPTSRDRLRPAGDHAGSNQK